MSSRVSPRAAIVVFSVPAIPVVALLALWVFPGFLTSLPNCPYHISAETRSSCAETITVFRNPGGPGGPAFKCFNGTVFHGAGLTMMMFTNGMPGSLVYVEGYLSTPSSPCQRFTLIGDPVGPASVNWTSQRDQAIVVWQTPYTFTENGVIAANLTLGVYLG